MGLGAPGTLLAWVETPDDYVSLATPVVVPLGVVSAPALAV